MNEFSFIALLLAIGYLLFAVFLLFYQRKLIYHPVQLDPEFKADEVRFNNDNLNLHGWILNPGQRQAVIYFGGNSELITHRSQYFEQVFANYSVYLINYRGYGSSEGSPSEAALFSDALAIYDQIQEKYDSISAYGRSLGSGVAVYLAANRPLQKLILLTPYDSIGALAQNAYPLFPINLLLKDRFDSASRAGNIEIPVLIASAELDREIALKHTLALRQCFTRTEISYQQIAGAAHNDIIGFAEYREFVESFID